MGFEIQCCSGNALPDTVHELVVFFVGADPKPDKIVLFAPSNRSVVQTDIDSPHSALPSKTQRAMKWVRLKELEFLISQVLDFLGQASVTLPKIRVGMGD
jgi:hypothetical protein